MASLKFHDRRLAQVAFVVDDIETAMRDHGRELHIGAWSLFSNFKFETLTYRGDPCLVEMTAAIAFSGEMMYELIQQTNDAPSVYLEAIQKTGFGFHHYGLMVESLDEAVKEYEARGHVLAQYSLTPNGIRAAYMDARPGVPGMVELLEISAAASEIFEPVYEAAKAWDGTSFSVTRYGG